MNTEVRETDILCRLHRSPEFSLQNDPSWRDIHLLKSLAEPGKDEYGIRFDQLADGKLFKLYVRGENNSIQLPAPGRGIKSVFFHSHPSDNYAEREYPQEHPIWFLPSGHFGKFTSWSGDLVNTRAMGANSKGGYLNVVTKNGVGLYVGVRANDDSYFLGRLRKKLGGENEKAGLACKIWTGDNAGETFADLRTFSPKDNKLLDETGVAVVSMLDYAAGQEHFFLCTTVQTLENTGISLKEVLFGEGLNKISDRFELEQFPLGKNLREVLEQSPLPDRDPMSKFED